MLLNAVDTEKGRFLRQVDRAVGGGLFELLADTNRVQRLPLLNLDDEEIMARSDCDPQGCGADLSATWRLASERGGMRDNDKAFQSLALQSPFRPNV